MSATATPTESQTGEPDCDEDVCTLPGAPTGSIDSAPIEPTQAGPDPSDLEAWLERHVPEGDPLFTHTSEGPDDMPSHIRAALTATTLSIPVDNRTLVLGTWQGIYLCEHRNRASGRRLVVTLHGE